MQEGSTSHWLPTVSQKVGLPEGVGNLRKDGCTLPEDYILGGLYVCTILCTKCMYEWKYFLAPQK